MLGGGNGQIWQFSSKFRCHIICKRICPCITIVHIIHCGHYQHPQKNGLGVILATKSLVGKRGQTDLAILSKCSSHIFCPIWKQVYPDLTIVHFIVCNINFNSLWDTLVSKIHASWRGQTDLTIFIILQLPHFMSNLETNMLMNKWNTYTFSYE